MTCRYCQRKPESIRCATCLTATYCGHKCQRDHWYSEGDSSHKEECQPLRFAMAKLWEDHIVWTRCFIMSALADLPDKGKHAERLLRNQDEIGAAIVPFYGQQAGDALAKLLREHITIAADLVEAAKSGSKSFTKLNKEWHRNADDIAAFLSKANPDNWPKETIRSMMYTHLRLTIDETSARLKQDWNADIRAYDENHTHMLMLSDALAEGIVKQFGGK